MKNLSVFGLALVGLLVSASALAAGAYSTNPVGLTVVEVDTSTSATNGTSTFLTFASWPNNKPACGTGPQAELTGSVDNVKALTSLATAALLSGKTIRVYWDGTCDGTAPRVSNILLLQ